MSYWTLAVDGVEKTFEQWGFGQLKRSRKSLDADTGTFKHITQDGVTTSPVIGAFKICTIWRDRELLNGVFSNGTKYFVGKVIKIPRAGSESDESTQYTLAGPWWYFENRLYEQPWYIYSATQPSGIQGVDWLIDVVTGYFFIIKRVTDLVLNQKLGASIAGNYDKVSTGQQIRDVLDWMVLKGAPIQFGSEFPSYTIPIDEAMAQNVGCPNLDVPLDVASCLVCSEVIKKMARWSPDVVAYWDYSTSPYPTLHGKVRSSLPVVTLPFGEDPVTGTKIIQSMDVTPRYDLQVPMVRIIYRHKTDVGGTSYAITAEDVYPNPPPPDNEQFGALVGSVDLLGLSANDTTAKVDVTTINLNDLTFWKRFFPYLNFVTSPTLTPSSGTRTGTNGYPNALNPDSAQIADWMNVHTEKETVSVKANFVLPGGVHIARDQLLKVNIISTDAISKNYVKADVTSFPEPNPVGLAKLLYTSMEVLQWSGRIVLKASEVPDVDYLGSVINVTGGATEWETMKATVTGVEEDVDEGTVTLEIGPAEHIGIADLVELLKVFRLRHVDGTISIRSGTSISSQQIQMGDETGLENSTDIQGWTPKTVFSGSANPGDAAAPGYVAIGAGTSTPLGAPSFSPSDVGSDSDLPWIDMAAPGATDGTVEIHLDDANGKQVYLQEIIVCVGDPPVKKKAIILMSDPYL